jgi:hypothetical protein
MILQGQRQCWRKKQFWERDRDMKKFILAFAATATLLIGSLATPSTAEARPWGWRGGYYGGGYYGGGYYGGYRPYYGGYYSRPYYYGNTYSPYRTYYRYPSYYYGSPGYYYGSPRYYYGPGYYGPGVRVGVGVGGVRVF